MKTTIIKQTVTIPASPKEVYSALMSSVKHTKITGAKALIGKKKGDPYYTYDGYITGRNIELVPGERIVQSWIAMEDKWPAGHESKITFRLKAKPARRGAGKVNAGDSTVISFLHEDVPEVIAKNFVTGWKDYYWNPLKAYFSGK